MIRVSHGRHLLTSKALLPFPFPLFQVLCCSHSVTPSLFMPPIPSPLRPCVSREQSALRLRFDLPQRQHACLEMKEAPRRCCLVAEEQACGKSRAQNVRRQSKWPLGASYEYVCMQCRSGLRRPVWSRPLIDSMICVSSQSSVPASKGASEGKR